jgi:hypothetical protein
MCSAILIFDGISLEVIISPKDGRQRREDFYVKDAVDMTIFLANVDVDIGGKDTYGIHNRAGGSS